MSFFIGLIFFCSLKIKVWAKQVAIPLNWPAKLAIKSELTKSEGLFDCPDEGAEAESRLFFVEGAKTCQHLFHFGVFHDGDDGRGERRPCVGAVVGFAFHRAASLHGAE